MKKCSNCNFENIDEALFCKSCGNKLLEEVQISESTPKVIDKKKKIKIISGLVAAVLAVILLANFITLAQRTTFSGKDDMLDYLQGTWSSYDSSGNVRARLIIKGDTITDVDYYMDVKRVDNKLVTSYVRKGETVYDDVKYSPGRGWFEIYSGTYGRYILTSDGKLIQSGNDYEPQRKIAFY